MALTWCLRIHAPLGELQSAQRVALLRHGVVTPVYVFTEAEVRLELIKKSFKWESRPISIGLVLVEADLSEARAVAAAARELLCALPPGMAVARCRAALVCASLLCVLFVVTWDGVGAASDAEPASDVEEVEALVAVARSRLARLSDDNFGDVVGDASGQRPYHLFVLFNARKVKHRCDICGAFEDAIALVAQSHAASAASDTDTPMFFARAEYDENKRSFSRCGVSEVPVLLYVPPRGSRTRSHGDAVAADDGDVYHGELDAHDIASFVYGRTGIPVEVDEADHGIVLLSCGVVLSLGLAVAQSGVSPVRLLNWALQSKLLWFAASVSIYYIAVSGVVFDIIREVPLLYTDEFGNWFMFAGSKAQYGLEGLVVGAAFVAMAGCVLALTVWIPWWFPDPKDGSARNIRAFYAMLVFALCWVVVGEIYKGKSRPHAGR